MQGACDVPITVPLYCLPYTLSLQAPATLSPVVTTVLCSHMFPDVVHSSTLILLLLSKCSVHRVRVGSVWRRAAFYGERPTAAPEHSSLLHSVATQVSAAAESSFGAAAT